MYERPTACRWRLRCPSATASVTTPPIDAATPRTMPAVPSAAFTRTTPNDPSTLGPGAVGRALGRLATLLGLADALVVVVL